MNSNNFVEIAFRKTKYRLNNGQIAFIKINWKTNIFFTLQRTHYALIFLQQKGKKNPDYPFFIKKDNENFVVSCFFIIFAFE